MDTTSGTMSFATMDDSIQNDSRLNKDDGSSVYLDSSVMQEEQLHHPLWDVEEVRCSLRRASVELSKRGLKLAAKWAAEQLIGLPSRSSATNDQNGVFWSTPDRNNKDGVKTLGTNHLHYELSGEEEDKVIYAQTLFDMGEFDNAAHILSCSSTSTPSSTSALVLGGGIGPPLPNLSSHGLFLRAYSLYLSGERRKEQELVEITRDPMERSTVTNSYLIQLQSELSVLYQQNKLDAFGIYVYGTVLKEVAAAKTAFKLLNTSNTNVQTVLLDSLSRYPYNWSAWLDLASVCINNPSAQEEVELAITTMTTTTGSCTTTLASHWMYYCFLIHVFLEQQQDEQALQLVGQLLFTSTDDQSNRHPSLLHQKVEDSSHYQGLFVQSNYLKAMTAVAYYNLRDFDTAQEHFLELCQRDPFRLEQMDVFSNILYVKESKAELRYVCTEIQSYFLTLHPLLGTLFFALTFSHLAHCAIRNDKYRPETCCIVGNYYSLKRQHEKAVQYFQRALKLDRSYLSAWTLMGHEFVEMKNTAAAIEAYRRAVDISPRDYRAWYGLGQTYEILNMQLYALFYYRKAATLRPYDARMWCAMGGCYLSLDKRSEAIRSYERAVSNHDREGIATQRLATLYKENGDFEKAAKCYQRHLDLQQRDNDGDDSNLTPLDEATAEALLYLAYYHKDHMNYNIAIRYASRLIEYPGQEKEQAKALLREIQSRIDSQRSFSSSRANDKVEFSFSP